ncbi:MAG: carbohydrate ABC transporter permease [Clostridia bacterium]|nr:carbohydrate ABC transporter permease [Clostridia bacterium]
MKQKPWKQKNRIRRSAGERIGYTLICIVLGLFAFSTIYPVWHVIMYSFSDSKRAMVGGLFFIPKGFSLLGYETVFKTAQIWIAYRNSLLVMIVGTIIAVSLSAVTAYPLSRKRLWGRNFFSMVFFFTMLFSGGTIPLYLQVSALGLLNTFWSMVLPTAMSAYNMFILRNFMKSIPDSLEESARIDGANDFVILVRVMLPLCAPSLAAVAMFYGVEYWNNYMNCLLYTNSTSLQVLPLYLRSVLASAASNALSAAGNLSSLGEASKVLTEETVKMTTVAVSVIPILIIYPFLQRYYTKGITIGAVKG